MTWRDGRDRREQSDAEFRARWGLGTRTSPDVAIAEAERRQARTETVQTVVGLFEQAGLRYTEAQEAAAGYVSGKYFSFEDAGFSQIGFGRHAGFIRGGYNVNQVVESIRRLAPQAPPRPLSYIEEIKARATGRALQERRTATQARPRIVESATARSVGETLFEACLIDAGEGSSGYYPTTTLQEAAKAGVFHAGVHCFVDHPTVSDRYERPERSVRDLAGCLESNAVYRDGGLWGRVRVYSSHRDLIADRASAIGLSILADGEVAERAGKGTPTIARIAKVHSVDFVTQAGRGGRLLT